MRKADYYYRQIFNRRQEKLLKDIGAWMLILLMAISMALTFYGEFIALVILLTLMIETTIFKGKITNIFLKS